MKALSIKNPMGILIALGVKDIENRTRKTHFRGKIYIHVSAKYMDSDFLDDYINSERFIDMSKKLHSLGVLEKNERIAEFLKKQPTSAIIGEVEIVDCVINHDSIWADKSYYPANFNSLPFGEEDEEPSIIYNWVLANPVLYDKPILNVKGKLSFWEYSGCHICHNKTEPDYECRNCGELVCDKCIVPYNQITQIDYNLCNNCQN